VQRAGSAAVVVSVASTAVPANGGNRQALLFVKGLRSGKETTGKQSTCASHQKRRHMDRGGILVEDQVSTAAGVQQMEAGAAGVRANQGACANCRQASQAIPVAM
jgi:hypothetical protein